MNPARSTLLTEPGTHLVRNAARLSDGRADALVAVHAAEHGRRQAVGLGAVLDLPLLDTLTTLPHGLPLPLDGLGERDQRRIAATPPGVIDRATTRVARLLEPALEVRSVYVSSGPWPTRLRRAASFSRFAPCMITLAREPTTEQLVGADFFGIGVVGIGPLLGRHFLEPSAPPPSFSAVHWLFRERAYDAWLSYAGDLPATREGLRRRA
jgi:hypothetical protein